MTEGDISFASIGTNDLTQLMYGFSRDDTAKFLVSEIGGILLEGNIGNIREMLEKNWKNGKNGEWERRSIK